MTFLSQPTARATAWLRSRPWRRAGRWAAGWGKLGRDLAFSPQCAYCDCDLVEPPDELLLCGDCRKALGPEAWRGCRRCGAAVHDEGPLPECCPLCRSVRLHFDTVVPLGGYRAELREAVLRMKRPAGEPLAEAMARLYVRLRAADVRGLQPDVIVPIPMHWMRRLVRKTNNPEILAARLGGELRLPLARRRLVQCRMTRPQKNLPYGERFRNVRGAFRLRRGYDFRGARVLLVDDVLTTGATCSEAAKILKQGGAAWVAVAVLDRAQRDKLP
jgi:ComF family protein